MNSGEKRGQKKGSRSAVITERFIKTICNRIAENKSVRRNLPLNGRLHIDRQLPFLCVYRHPLKRHDNGTNHFVKGEAAYLTISGNKPLLRQLTPLLSGIIKTLNETFGAFLILEIWSSPELGSEDITNPSTLEPTFNIFARETDLDDLSSAIMSLENELKKIRILKRSAAVEIHTGRKISPPGMSPLLSAAEARKLNCRIIGLEISPIYRNPVSGELFPVLLRALHRQLAPDFKRVFYEFSRTNTVSTPTNYHAMGRRSVVKAVWETDRRLAEVSNAFDFLLLVSPVNTEAAWVKFKRQRFERVPTLYYRPLSIDPANHKHKLFEISIDSIEDPTLAYLFREKRSELDRQISMLADRGTKDFLFGSMQVFGDVSETLFQTAQAILNTTPSRQQSSNSHLTAPAFAKKALAEIEYYRERYPAMTSGVNIRKDISGLMVSRGKLLVGTTLKIPEKRVQALLQHEVGTHIVTYFNGRSEPFKQLYSGLAGYEELQEGLAVLAEFLVDGFSVMRLRMLAARVIAVRSLTQGASFIETFRELTRNYRIKQRTAFSITVRVYRGGGLTKDAVYLRGLLELLNYLKKGGDLDPLFVGKISMHHIPIIKELQFRKVLQPPPLRPRYMEFQETAKKLKRLRNGLSVMDLIQ